MPEGGDRGGERGTIYPRNASQRRRLHLLGDVQGGPDLGVTEVLLDQFGVEPLGQEQRRAPMPQVMEAHGPKPSVLQDLLEPMAKDRSVEGLLRQ